MERGTASASVLVADDHPMFRHGVTRAIREHPDLDVIGEATTGALAKVRRLRPTILLLDVQMPGMGGVEVLEKLVREGIAVRVILCSGYASGVLAHQAIAAGAAGYLAKEDTDDRPLCEALIDVSHGKTVLSPSLQEAVLQEVARRPAGWIPLSRRERETLQLAAEGCRTAAIAERLHLSTTSVKTFLTRAIEKLGAPNLTAAAVEASRRRLL